MCRSTSKSARSKAVFFRYSGHIQLKWSRAQIKIACNKLLDICCQLLILLSLLKQKIFHPYKKKNHLAIVDTIKFNSIKKLPKL